MSTGKCIWFISDLHFDHANMVAGGRIGTRSQFSTVEDMNEHIVSTINDTVQAHEKLYLLGDLTLQRRDAGHALRHVRRLNGHKRLLLGNHDHLDVGEYVTYGGIEKVMSYRELAGMLFSHIPVHPSQFSRFRANVHGHTHDSLVQCYDLRAGVCFGSVDRPDPRYLNVCVEPRHYIPISLDEIVTYVEALER